MGTLRAAILVVLLLSVLPIAVGPPAAEAAGSLQAYATGLNVPIALAFSPDGRVFYAERNTGSIRAIVGGTPPGTLYYTLAGTATGGERGLLGLALDPGFPATPSVYAYQTYNDVANGTVYNRVVRITGNATGSSHSVIAQFPPVLATNHNGGVIAFGTDGKLYVVIGEDANPAHSQDLTTPKGKVLRMNSDGSAPTDNPFYGDAIADWRIYTYGHRNMFGLTFHPAAGQTYVTENGPGCNDEINVLVPGSNYGWGPTQTCASPPPPPNNTNRDGLNPVLPIDWYTPTTAPTNAAIYLGPGFPAWQGDLIFGEWRTGLLRRLDLGPPGYDAVLGRQDILTAPSGILDVESGPDGAIWFTTGTTIYRYVDTARPPVAAFVAAPQRTTPGVTITFDASSSVDPDGTILSWVWDFGDGQPGTGQVTGHSYGAPGAYTVTLTVVDNETLSDTATLDVIIDAPPVSAFTYAPPVPDPGEIVTFDASSANASGRIVSYDWDFGDGAIGTGVVATHAYATAGTYDVTLTVVDNASLSDSEVQSLRVNAPPRPAFTATPPQSYVHLPIAFNASASTDPDGTVAFVGWDFGDGDTATGAIASHEYAAKGPFTVTLTVADNDGTANATTRVVFIGNRPPQIAATNPTSSAVSTSVGASLMMMVVAVDPDGDALTYAWTVDGVATPDANDTIAFSRAQTGQYLVHVTVSDGADSVSHAWTVEVRPLEPATPFPWWAVALVALAAILALAVFLLWRRKRRART